MSTVSEGFFKQLRRDVKNKASNYKIHQFLNSIYDEGYRQGIKAATQRAAELIQPFAAPTEELINVTEQDPNNGNNDDRVLAELHSSQFKERSGTDAADSNRSQRGRKGLRTDSAV